MKTNLILVNQVTGPLFIDMANYYSQHYSKVVLLTGNIEPTGQVLNPKIEVRLLKKYNRNNPIQRIFTWLYFSLQTYFFFKNTNIKAKVLLVSNPPFVPLLAAYLQKNTQLQFYVLIYDIYPDLLIKTGYLKASSFISKWWAKKNTEAFGVAEKLFTITDGMEKVLSKYSPKKWCVVYPWVDTAFIKPIPKQENPFVKKYNLEGKIVIQYSGNMGKSHDLLSLLEAAKELGDASEFVFLLIGDGAQKDHLEAYAKTHELMNVIFLPFQDKASFPYSITAADIGVVSLTDEASEMAIPSKTFYQMAAGNAILAITNESSELATIIKNHKCGFVVEPVNPNKLIELLRSLNKESLINKQTNSSLAITKYDMQNVLKFDL